jgi:hypothetical protein
MMATSIPGHNTGSDIISGAATMILAMGQDRTSPQTSTKTTLITLNNEKHQLKNELPFPEYLLQGIAI